MGRPRHGSVDHTRCAAALCQSGREPEVLLSPDDLAGGGVARAQRSVSWATSRSPRPPSSKTLARRRCGEVLLPSETSQMSVVSRTGAVGWGCRRSGWHW